MKVQSTLKQFVRDWSGEGAAERNACYGPILTELQRAYPDGNARSEMKAKPDKVSENVTCQTFFLCLTMLKVGLCLNSRVWHHILWTFVVTMSADSARQLQI